MWAVLCATDGRLHPGPHPPGPCGIQTHPASGPVASVFMPATPWEFLRCTLGGSTHHERNFWQLCADKGGGGTAHPLLQVLHLRLRLLAKFNHTPPRTSTPGASGNVASFTQGWKVGVAHAHTGLGFRDAVLCRLVSAPP